MTEHNNDEKAGRSDVGSRHAVTGKSTPHPDRKSVRLCRYDYSQVNDYFITICTRSHTHIFGAIRDGAMQLNAEGHIALRCLKELPNHFTNILVSEYVVMPNHVHAIIEIQEARHAVPLREEFGKPTACSLPTIVRSYKSAVTRAINAKRGVSRNGIWQRSYYEHIIRNTKLYKMVREYIRDNPRQWEYDRENPLRKSDAKPAEKEAWRV